jgi:Arc/MetJ family transcription regulator
MTGARPLQDEFSGGSKMSTTPTPAPTLADAIAAVDQANTAYQATAGQTAIDLTAEAAAEALVTQDESGLSTATAAYVAALQNLVAVANAQISALTPASGS